MSAILLQVLPASLYAALAAHFWRTRWHRDAAPRSAGVSKIEQLGLLLALCAHGLLLQHELFPDAGMRFGFALAASLMVWLAVVFYWVENFHVRLDGLQTLALPVAALASLLPGLFPATHPLMNASTPIFRAHFILAMLAYSLFTLAALHALLMALTERRLHGGGRLNRALASLPPLMTMERLLFRLIGVAFALLTLTLGSGALFSEALFGKPFSFNHKTVFALTSWLLFGILLLGRHLWGWRGRKALRWTLAGFVALLLAYLGSRFVIEVLLERSS